MPSTSTLELGSNSSMNKEMWKIIGQHGQGKEMYYNLLQDFPKWMQCSSSTGSCRKHTAKESEFRKIPEKPGDNY